MPDDAQGNDEEESRLLSALKAAVEQHDPVPPAVEQAARESFTWRTIDAELADLAYDSLLDDTRLAGVRSGDAPRTLTFEGPAFAVELEVTVAGDRRRLLGQLVPPAGADIEVRHSGEPLRVDADRMGRFAADVESGLVSLRCQLHGREGAPLETAWVLV